MESIGVVMGKVDVGWGLGVGDCDSIAGFFVGFAKEGGFVGHVTG